MQINDKTDLSIGKNSISDEKVLMQKNFPIWTGFGDKTLWDIIQFISTIAVPFVLFVLSAQQSEIARNQEDQNQKWNDDNQKSKIMSDYLDSMTNYLLQDPAKVTDINKANMIARARTLNTLRQLDPDRKGQLLKFLYEASLVKHCLPSGKGNDCNISKLVLNGARLDGVAFEIPPILPGIELNGASLSNAKLPDIDLTNAQLEKATLPKADLARSILTEAQMTSVNLQDSKINDAILNRAVLSNALLKNADLRGASLVGTNLSGADLTNANLNNANLENADLRNAILTGTSLERSNLQGAKYNVRTTKFPVDFKPDGRGMIRQD